MRLHTTTTAVLFAFAPPAHAGLLEDVGECLDKSIELALITKDAAASIAGMLADPALGLCVAQVLLPDPLTIAGSGAVVAVAAATSIPPGQCDAGLRDKAFDPLIGALSGITGLSTGKEPLKSVLANGKDAAWSYLKDTPPSSLVWSKLTCGCTFFDKGTAIEDIKKVAEATTAAGKSCGKVLSSLADGAWKAISDPLTTASCAVEAASEFVGDLHKGDVKGALKGKKLINRMDYYAQYWQPFEPGYVYLWSKPGGNVVMGTPLPGTVQLVQGDPASVGVARAWNGSWPTVGEAKSLDQLRKQTREYYECIDNSSGITNQINDVFYKSADAKLVIARGWVEFDAAAKKARVQKIEFYRTPWEGKDGVTAWQLGQIDAAVDAAIAEGWKIYEGMLIGGQKSSIDEVLDLAFQMHEKTILDQVAAVEQAHQAAKNKSFIAPIRRLVADGNLEKLGKLGGEKLCTGMHALLAAECRRETEAVQKAADAVLKQRDNTKNWTMSEGASYGKADGTKQLTANSRYTYAPTIANPRDDAAWADGAKFDAVLKADTALRDGFVTKMEARAAPYAGLQDRLDKLVSVYEMGCGDAIGTPGAAATPMCREYLANGVAACLVDGHKKKTQPPATAFDAKAGVDTKAGFALGNPAGTAKPAPASGGVAQAGLNAGAALPPAAFPGAGAVPAHLAVSECDASAKAALDRYAKVHQQSPGKDRPVTNFFANLKPAAPASSVPRGLPADAAPTGRLRTSPAREGETGTGRALRPQPEGMRETGERRSGTDEAAPPTRGLRLPPAMPDAPRGLGAPALPDARTPPAPAGRGDVPAVGGRLEPPAAGGLRPLPTPGLRPAPEPGLRALPAPGAEPPAGAREPARTPAPPAPDTAPAVEPDAQRATDAPATLRPAPAPSRLAPPASPGRTDSPATPGR